MKPTAVLDEGRVRLYLGDCLEILPTFPKGKIDAVVTDPPYGMSFQSGYRQVKHRPIENDETDALLLWACGIPTNHSAYVFCRWDNLHRVPPPQSFITWVKNNWSMGDLKHEHARQTEGCLFYPGTNHHFPNERPTDVIQAARTANEYHPSEKPVGLMRGVVKWTCGRVFDFFMGSGTTGVVCVQLRRPFVGIELDPTHFDTAVRRIEAAIAKRNSSFQIQAGRPQIPVPATLGIGKSKPPKPG